MQKGDIILIHFPFTNFSGFKLRPAVVLAVCNDDITACFITTNIFRLEKDDILISPDELNGLKKQSAIKPLKIMTFERNKAIGKLGKISLKILMELNSKLKAGLDL